MKKKSIYSIYLFVITVLIAACSVPPGSPPPGNLWPKRLGGTVTDEGNALAVDSSGNVTVVGSVALDADLNGNNSIASGIPETATGTYGGYDVFIAQFSSSGTFRWAKRLGGIFADSALGVAVDTSGNVIVTGSVNGSADLNGDGSITPGLPETSADPYGGIDIFVSKFNSSGTFQWAKRLGGVNNDYGYAVAADSSGNIFVTGVINGNADINGNESVAGTFPETAPGATGDDIFLVKFNAAGTDQGFWRLWSSGQDAGYAVAADASGSIVVTGMVNGDADLDGDGAISPGLPETASGTYGSSDIFISAFDNAGGSFHWAQRLGGTGSDEGHGVAISSSGNVYAAGFVSGDADLNGDGSLSGTLPETATVTYGNEDAVVSVFSSTGTAVWSGRLGGGTNDRALGIARDGSDNLIVTGFVSGNADLDADGSIAAGSPETASGIHGLADIFGAKFDAGGNPLWSARLGGTNDDEGRGVGTDSGGNIYLTGSIQESADLDNDDTVAAGLPETVSGVYGSYDVFISKLAGQ